MTENTLFIEFNPFSDYKDIIRTIHNNENIINIVFQICSLQLIEKNNCEKIEGFFNNLSCNVETIDIIIDNYQYGMPIYCSERLNKVYLNNLPLSVKKVFISNKLVKIKKIPFGCKVIYLNRNVINQDYEDFTSYIKPIN